MRTEKQLLNKYIEYTNSLSLAEITFKRKEDFEVSSRMLKEIKSLRKLLVKEMLSTSIDATQIKMRFKRR